MGQPVRAVLVHRLLGRPGRGQRVRTLDPRDQPDLVGQVRDDALGVPGRQAGEAAVQHHDLHPGPTPVPQLLAQAVEAQRGRVPHPRVGVCVDEGEPKVVAVEQQPVADVVQHQHVVGVVDERRELLLGTVTRGPVTKNGDPVGGPATVGTGQQHEHRVQAVPRGRHLGKTTGVAGGADQDRP